MSSMPYLKGDAPSLLDTFVPKITHAYITSRLDSVRAVAANGATEDPLDNDEQLQVGGVLGGWRGWGGGEGRSWKFLKSTESLSIFASKDGCAKTGVQRALEDLLEGSLFFVAGPVRRAVPPLLLSNTAAHQWAKFLFKKKPSPFICLFCILQDQLDSLPYLCRFQYSSTADYLVGLMDPLITAYSQLGSSSAG